MRKKTPNKGRSKTKSHVQPKKQEKKQERLDLVNQEKFARIKWEFIRDDPAYPSRYDEFKALCVRIVAESISDPTQYCHALKSFQEDFGVAYPIDPQTDPKDLTAEEVLSILHGANVAPYVYSRGIDEFLHRFFSTSHGYFEENQTFENETHLTHLESYDPEKVKEIILGGMDDPMTMTIQIDMRRVNSISALKAFLEEAVDVMAKLLTKDIADYLRDERRLREILKFGRMNRQPGMTYEKLAEMLYDITPKEDDDPDKGVSWNDAEHQEKYIGRIARACKAYKELIRGGYKKMTLS